MKQHHAIRRTVNDDGKEVQNVAAKHAHVQCIILQTSGVGTAERDRLTIISPQANLGLDINRIRETAHPSKSILGLKEWKI